jgi:hypothetical protein
MRNHSGGFINADFIWDIGTPDRGRDGMTARDAAKRYNDHRHSAAVFSTAEDFNAWITEKSDTVYNSNNIDMGTIAISNFPIRKEGDIASFGGFIWMFDGNGVIPLGKTGVAFNSDTLEIEQSKLINEFNFTNYSYEATTGNSTQGAITEKLIGTVVIDFSRYDVFGASMEANLELVASIVDTDYNILVNTQMPNFSQNAQEGGDLSLFVLFRLESIGSTNSRFSGAGQTNVFTGLPLNAYASTGDEIIEHVVPVLSNTKVKYSLFMSKPSLDDFLQRSNIQLDDTQKESVQEILDKLEVSITKASIVLKNVIGS